MKKNKPILKKILIVGGTSGLGLELAKIYSSLGHTVMVTGRKDPKIKELKFIRLSITQNASDLVDQIDNILKRIKKVNTLIYCAGFYQEGQIEKLTNEQILEMINVGLTTPAMLVRKLKNNPGKPLKIMIITSSSQYTPREKEPIYTSVKAGLGMFGASLSLDPTIGKVLVVAPSGMKTPFWDKNKDILEYLDPKWVAEQVVELSSGPFKYRYAKILRKPPRVEIVETRK